MKALVLAAGEGRRLRPLTLRQPKPMLPVAGKPVLEHVIALLRQHGVTDIAINLHHRPQAIVNYFGDGERFGVRITYSWEKRLLGSAGAVKKLARYFRDGAFFVVYGDLLTDLDLTALGRFHTRVGAAVTVALYWVEEPARCGIVELLEDGRIGRFVEKPAPEEAFSNLANAGVYVMEPWIAEYIPDATPYDFGHDLFPRLLREGVPIYGYPIKEYLVDIGSPERYHRACWEWPLVSALGPGVGVSRVDPSRGGGLLTGGEG